MQGAVPAGEGAMAAVLGLSDASLTKFVSPIVRMTPMSGRQLQLAGQVVIAGHAAAVSAALLYERSGR